MYKNVLWIDPAVKDYPVFVDSVNADTLALVYPEPIGLHSGVERIGFVFEKHGPMATYLLENANMLIGLGIKHMDFLACDTLPEWQGFYDTLTGDKLTGITVGSSNNKTGNLKYGGDWLMESTCEDVERVYFTQSIEYYKYLLGLVAASYIFKVDNLLWGIGDNTQNQLGISNASPLTSFVNITALQTPEFINGTIVDLDWNTRSTIVTMSNGTVWMAGYPNHQYDKSPTFEFVKVKLTTDANGTNVVGTPILAKIRRVTDDISTFPRGNIWLITKSGTTYNLYIYAGDRDYTDGGTGAWTVSSNTFFNLANTKWKDTTIRTDLQSGPITNIYIESFHGITRIFCTSTNVYVSSYYNHLTDRGLMSTVSPASGIDITTYKLVNVTTPTKAILNYDPEFVYYLQNGNVYTELNGTYTKCKSGGIDITGVTHLESNNKFIAIVTNNASVWTVNAPFTPTSTTDFYLTSTREFTVYPRNFGTISDIGIYNRSNINTLLVRSGNTIYNANLTTTSSSSVISTLSDYVVGATSLINSSANIYGNNFSTSNISYLYVGDIKTPVTIISSRILQFKVPILTSNVSIQLYTSTGPILVTTSFTAIDYYATCFFGYFKPTLSNTYQFNISSDNLVKLRIGSKTLYDLRSGGTTLVNLNASTLLTSPDIQLTNTSYYPLLLTYVNTYPVNVTNLSVTIRNTVKVGAATATALLPFCTTDKTTPGLFCYNLNGEQLRQTTGLTWSPNYNASVLQQFDRIYSPTWAFGTLAQQTFWNDSTNLSLLEGPVPTTPLNISTIQLENQILTIQGTGLHANVSVFLDNIPQKTFGTLNVSVLANFSQVRLADGFAQSTVYSTFNITSINLSTALRNSSVNLLGTALTNVSAITVGTANASFAILSNKVEMRVPDSTQTLEPLTVYDKNGGTAIITSFTIPPLFTITGLNPSSLPQNTSLTILGDNFSNMSYVIVGTTSAKLNLATTTFLNVSVPNGVVGNVSVTAVDIYNNRVFIDGLTVYAKLSVSSINPSVAVRGTPLTLTGLNFYNLSYLNTGGTKIFLPNFSYTTTAIQFAHTLTTPGNISIGVYDSFNNASLSFTLPSLFSVSSYTPSSVIPRNALQIRGSNFSNLSHVQFGSMPIPLTSFTTTLINVSVPNGLADVVSITVVDLYGNTSSIASNLSILNLKFTSVSPAVAVEGTPLTITGDNLSNVSYVLFGNLSNPPTSTSKTTVQVVVPTGVSQIDTFTLQDVYGNTLTSPFTTATLFSVSGFNPSTQKPQRTLEITGANFSNLSYVKFGDKTQQPFQYTDSTLNVSVPAGLPSTVEVTVFNQFSTGRFVGNLSVLNLSIQTVSPTVAVKGQPLTITGAHFFDLSYVQLGSKVFLPNFAYTETQVTLITPATSGNLSLIVGDFYGNNTSLSYTVNPVFTLTGYNLSSVIPQTLVQIRGANLSNLSKIQFGDTKVDPFEVTLNYVNVSVPTGLANTVPVTILDLFGNTASLSNLSILNLSIGAWPLTAVQREPLTLTGDNLSNASYVLFGTYVQQVLTKNKTSVTVKVPDDTNTSGYMTLYDIYQNNSSVPFTVKTLFNVSALSTQYVVPNQPITITGSNFENVSYLMFGNVSTQSFTYSLSQINVSVPTNALGNVSVFVHDIFTNVKNLSNLNISAKLVLTAIQPSIAVKGTPLTLTGSNFYDLSYIQVAGTTLYQPFNYTVNQITFVQPTLTVGNTSMIVQDIYGNNTSLSFVVNPVFTLTGYNLSSVIPQTLVQIRGANFSNLSKIQFGDNQVDPFEVTLTYVNVSVPTGLANSVPVTVLDLFGNTASLSNLSILNLSIGTWPLTAVQRAPLTLTGDNLSNASYVLFGTYAQQVIGKSQTTVTVKVPDDTNTSGYLTLYDIYENNISVPFTVKTLFTLTSLSTQYVVPNQPITITGSNFENLSDLLFGNVSTQSYTYSPTQINVSVPTNALGNVSVFVYDIFTNVKSLSNLNISAKLLLTSINTGVYNAPILLTGNHFYNVSVHVGGTLVNFSYDVTSIRFANPLYSGNVSVGVYDPYGNNASIAFVTQPLFSVTGYNLSVIPRRPLQITGTNFSNLSTVRLGSYPVYDFSYNSQSILFTVPTGLPDLVSVTVVDLYGNTSSVSDNLSILNLKLASVSPAVAVQGTPLTILGDQLANVSYVVFGNVSAPPSTVSKGVVTVTVPTGVTIINAVSLLDVYGNTASISFATTALFSVSGFASSSVKPQRTLQIQGLNFSNLSYVQFGDKNVTSLQYTDTMVNVSVPTGLPANVPVTVFNQFSTGLFVGNLSVLNLYVNAITPRVAVKGTPLTITGSNFYDLSYIQMETKLFLPNFSYNETTIQLNTPSITPGNVSVGIVDVDGNNVSIGFMLRNLSYAFQVGNQLTLVGTGLAGLSPGFPTLYESDTAPMFTAPLLTGVRTVNLSQDGYSTDTVTIYPVTVIQANLATPNTDVISVRAMPTGKIPDNVYTV